MCALAVLIVFLTAEGPSRAGLAGLASQSEIAGERICAATPLRTFYERREWQPAWAPHQIDALLQALQALPEDGLPPNRHHQAALLREQPPLVRELLATDAFLLAAGHLSRGAVDAQFSRPAWCAPLSDLDLAAILQSALDDDLIAPALRRLAPQHARYARLRSALASYRSMPEWEPLPEGRSLRRGDHGPAVAALRLRLESTLPPSPRFDAETEELVRDFQARHGIVEDGIVGPETRRELNVTRQQRIRQLEANLERWRWMPADPGGNRIVVNIAAFRLEVYEQEYLVTSMKTVVGKDYTRTPFFAAHITDVVVNPSWNVPDSIASKELWPRQARDSSYLASQHIVVTREGRLRQTPGPWNSLGRLKFNMPNRFNVYLHDTPAKSLFERTMRAFSHGCIRVERPRELALHLLRDQERWNAATLEAAIEAGHERSLSLTEPVPVYILYWTAWVDEDDVVRFQPDLYGRDAEVIAALDAL